MIVTAKNSRQSFLVIRILLLLLLSLLFVCLKDFDVDIYSHGFSVGYQNIHEVHDGTGCKASRLENDLKNDIEFWSKIWDCECELKYDNCLYETIEPQKHDGVTKTCWGHKNMLGSQKHAGVTKTCWGHKNMMGSQKHAGVTKTCWGHKNMLGSQKHAGVTKTCWGHKNMLGSQKHAGVTKTCWGHKNMMGSQREENRGDLLF